MAPQLAPVRDAYGRPLNNLRLAVTNECNYRCVFCHLEGDPLGEPARPGRLPPIVLPREYGIVARAARLLGIDSFKITGGEPLIRRDIVEIVRSLSENAPGSDISMTTNGYLLSKLAPGLAEAGLRRVNISIHSLDEERYRFITGVKGLYMALKGLEAARDQGFKLKVNMVVLKGVNEDEIFKIAELAHANGAVLQLIELHPVGLGAKFFSKYFYPLSLVEKKMMEMGARVERRSLHNRPVYVLPGGVRIEVVRPHANPIFCAGCSRVRLSATGHLTPCLNWKGHRIHLLPRIRSAGSEEEAVMEAARALLEVNFLRKPYYMVKRVNKGDGSLTATKFPGGNGAYRIEYVPKKSEYLKLVEALGYQPLRG